MARDVQISPWALKDRDVRESALFAKVRFQEHTKIAGLRLAECALVPKHRHL